MSTQVTNNANVNENANNNNGGVVINETAAANVKAANPITQLLSEGAKRIKDVTVKNLNATEKDAYTMVSLQTKMVFTLKVRLTLSSRLFMHLLVLLKRMMNSLGLPILSSTTPKRLRLSFLVLRLM